MTLTHVLTAQKALPSFWHISCLFSVAQHVGLLVPPTLVPKLKDASRIVVYSSGHGLYAIAGTLPGLLLLGHRVWAFRPGYRHVRGATSNERSALPVSRPKLCLSAPPPEEKGVPLPLALPLAKAPLCQNLGVRKYKET